MTVFTDNANQFATRAPDRLDQLRNAGVRHAIKLLRNQSVPESRRVDAAWTTMIMSLDHQARVAGIVLDAAWWTRPLDPACVELVEKAS